MRRVLVSAGLVLALALSPLEVARGQLEPGAPASVVGDGSGAYLEAAPAQLLGGLGRATAELDVFPTRPSLEEVKGGALRRRLLELRLLMDFNAYAYEPELMQTFRAAVDDAYESIGFYKDAWETQALLGEELPPDVVNQRLVKMIVALAPLRSSEVRDSMAAFFAAPAASPSALKAGQLPRLWALAAAGPDEAYDSVGNLALVGQRVLRNLASQGLVVGDIFDVEQEARFHDIRKAIRSVLVLDELFPATRDGAADLRPPLARLVSVYGDVNDRVVAYHAAQSVGRGVDERANDLATTFADALDQQRQLLDDGSIDRLIERLEAIQRAHRR